MSIPRSRWSRHIGTSICDTHMHVFQMPSSSAEPQGSITPDVPAGALSDYQTVAARLGIQRHVVVQPSHFGTDNRTTMAAVRAFGAHETRAVVIPPADVDEDEIARLSQAGAVAVRIFLLRDTGLGAAHLDTLARIVAPFGWHFELQCDGAQLAEILPLLERLPVPTVVDHLGRMPKGTAPDTTLFQKLVRHVASGRGWVKLSAPYHNSTQRSGFEDLRPQVEALARAAPERLVWATNWPHVQFRQKPDDLALAEALLGLLGGDALAHRVLVENPVSLYRFG